VAIHTGDSSVAGVQFHYWKNIFFSTIKLQMNYTPEERSEVIRQAYRGLFELVAPILFDKYVDFIDIYAEIRKESPLCWRLSLAKRARSYSRRSAKLMMSIDYGKSRMS
jgi:hypothetical protein